MIDVVLLREHTHAGRKCLEGENLTLTKQEADFLVKHGVAKLAEAKTLKGK